MKKNSKNSSVQSQSQLSQKEVTPLSTLTMDELESVQGGAYFNHGGSYTNESGWYFGYISSYRYAGQRCYWCNSDNSDG